MKTKISQAVLGGLAGTAAMTMVTFVAPLMGMPKMNPAEMLSGMTKLPLFAGWTMHFMIGVIFTLLYVFLMFPLLKRVSGTILKGLVFGMSVFIFAQIAMAVMGAMLGGMPSPAGNMVLIVMGGIIGHLVYGVVSVQFVREK